MKELNPIREVCETWENSRVIWVTKEKQRYKNFSNLFAKEGDNYDDWSKEHINLANYMRKGYKLDRGINSKDWNKIKYWDIDKIKNYIKNETDDRYTDIVQRVKEVVGCIEKCEMLEFDIQNITRIKVYGTSCDALVVVKFSEKNGQLYFKTFINESRRYF